MRFLGSVFFNPEIVFPNREVWCGQCHQHQRYKKGWTGAGLPSRRNVCYGKWFEWESDRRHWRGQAAIFWKDCHIHYHYNPCWDCIIETLHSWRGTTARHNSTTSNWSQPDCYWQKSGTAEVEMIVIFSSDRSSHSNSVLLYMYMVDIVLDGYFPQKLSLFFSN